MKREEKMARRCMRTGVVLLFFGICGILLPLESMADAVSKKEMAFIVAPYLVKPGTDTMTVMFEAHCAFAGLFLRKKGEADFTRIAAERIPVLPTLHRVRLSGLASDTVFEYRIESLTRKSPLYRFRTWPDKEDGVETVRLVAFSDSQGDHPERLRETVEKGILQHEAKGNPDQVCDAIRGVLIPGDLVITGSDKEQWKRDFFPNIAPLAARVPLLPALGNHDMLPFLFACYFDLLPDGNPEPEDAGYFYRTDLLNVSILTLDTNAAVDDPELPDFTDLLQRPWLREQLAEIKEREETDFLLAQFHHPCKSELWPPGNCRRSCDYVALFEAFTKETGKPSAHLFGHTHGYSRGQSRDVPHLWVNVATTAGDIDYWGEYDQIDYDEIQKSVDAYGYVTIEITNGKAPEMRFLRRSGGNGIVPTGYAADAVTDQFSVGRYNTAPPTPEVRSAISMASGGLSLAASPFLPSVTGQAHLETHWQVAGDATFADSLQIWGNATRAENLWYGENLQKGVDITRYMVTEPVPDKAWVRVRYRDAGFTWSAWSDAVPVSALGD